MKRDFTKIWIYIFIFPTLVFFVFFYLVPIVTIFTSAFTEWDGFNPWRFVGIKNYIKLITYDNTFIIAVTNLFFWSLIAATVHVGFGTVVAFILYRKPFGWKVVKSLFMVPNVISIAAWAIMYKFIFNDEFGVINNIIRALGFGDFHIRWFYESPFAFFSITLTWVFYAVYVTLIVLIDLNAIPEDIQHAARIDGASEWQIALKINLPLARGAIGTSIILSVTARIAMFENILLTTRGGPGNDTYNLTLMVYEGIVNHRYGYANAASTIIILFGIGVLWAVSRVFRMNSKVYE